MKTTSCGGAKQRPYIQLLHLLNYKTLTVSPHPKLLQNLSPAVNMRLLSPCILSAFVLGVHSLATPRVRQIRNPNPDLPDPQPIKSGDTVKGGRSDKWKAALAKGDNLLQQTQIEQRGGQRGITITDLQTEGWSVQTRERATIPDDVATALQVDKAQDCEMIEVAKQASRTLHVKSIYCKLTGIIVAVDEYILPEESFRWSDISFAVWNELITMDDPGNIHWFVEYDIDNVPTLDLLYETFGDLPEGEIHIAADKSDELKILLGNSNGAGHAYFLFQHQSALLIRSIQKGLVWDGGGGKLSFATEIGPPVQPPTGIA